LSSTLKMEIVLFFKNIDKILADRMALVPEDIAHQR
jgi:hypothetical protein